MDCARGRWPIIAQLDRDIAGIAPAYEVHQIKEKFGGLRNYDGVGEAGFDPRIDALVAAAEQVAARTCEYCGAPGTARGGGWIKTLCDDHARERSGRTGGEGW